MAQSKFSVGDIVTCVENSYRSISSTGAGWVLGMSYKIHTIYLSSTGEFLYFPNGGNGVLEAWLSLAQKEWD